MVVSKVEFQAALTEINESYAKLLARIEQLEKAAKPEPKKKVSDDK